MTLLGKTTVQESEWEDMSGNMFITSLRNPGRYSKYISCSLPYFWKIWINQIGRLKDMEGVFVKNIFSTFPIKIIQYIFKC